MRFDKYFAALIVALPAFGFLPGVAAAATPEEIAEAAPETAWRTLDPENTLYMDLPSGRIIIEMRPEFAPTHVDRIRTLTRQGFYNGVMFHRVIEGFMAQGGDPTGTGRGGSDLPDIPGEFIHAVSDMPDFSVIGRDARAARIGFLGPVPVGAQPATLSEFLVEDYVTMWGMHCRGVMSMARANDPNSANSQFFLMFADNRASLDQRYTVWGRVVDGMENARRINRGEPPERPTPIVRMRVAADVPADELVSVQIMRTDTPTFDEYLTAASAVSDNGFVDDVCNINIPAKIDGEVDL